MNDSFEIKQKKGSKPADVSLKDKVITWKLKGKKETSINLKPDISAVESLDDTSFTVGPTNEGTYVTFKANSKEVADKWVKAIEEFLKEKSDENYNLDKSTKEGWVIMQVKKGSNRYLVLLEGTLRWFSKADKGIKSFKSELYLYECKVSESGQELTVTPSDERKPVVFSVNLKKEVKPWIEALNKEIEEAKKLGPQGKKKKSGLGARMKKGMAQKLATSKGAKKVLNKEATDLLRSLRKVVAAYSGPKKADEVEQSLIKILTKMYFAVDNNQVPIEEFLKADKPMRAAFKTVSLIWGGRFNRVRKGQDPKKIVREAFQSVQQNWKQVENILVKALSTLIKPKSIHLIRQTLTFLRDPEFIKFVAKNDKLEDERLELEMAMDSYTAVELNFD